MEILVEPLGNGPNNFVRYLSDCHNHRPVVAGWHALANPCCVACSLFGRRPSTVSADASDCLFLESGHHGRIKGERDVEASGNAVATAL